MLLIIIFFKTLFFLILYRGKQLLDSLEQAYTNLMLCILKLLFSFANIEETSTYN